MHKQDFLTALSDALYGLPQSDIDQSIEYYSEIIDDQMEEGISEEEAVASLGAPDAVAKQILMDTALPKLVKAKVKPSRTLFNTATQEEKTYSVTESFENIDIQTTECNIVLLPSEKNVCEIVCTESDKSTHTVSVENNTLKVVRKDTRKWYERIGVSFSASNFEIKVYLPKGEYEALQASSASGNIIVSDALSFSKAELSTASGNISYASNTKNAWNGKTFSGDIEITNIIGETVNAKSTSGEITLKECQADAIELVSTSGDISLEDTIAETRLSIKTTSGEVSLESCDSEDIAIQTISGDVIGTLRSEKQFITSTTSGDISHPDSTSGSQKCTVNTTSGDIRLTVE